VKERYSHEFSAIQKFLQKYLGMWRVNRDSIDFKWGFFCPTWCLDLNISKSHLTFGFIWGRITIAEKGIDWFRHPQYGFSVIGSSILLYWGSHSLVWDMPFLSLEWEHDNIEVDGRWRRTGRDERHWEVAGKEAARQTFDYTYRLESGEIQNRTVTVYKRQMVWGRKWAPFLKYKRTFLDVTFNEEIGERVDTWKGGTTGCSFDMLPNETIEQCVRRNEATRKFL